MFVEKLTYEQRDEIARKIVTKNCYRYTTTFGFVDNKPCIEIYIYDRIHGNFSMFLFDTYFHSQKFLKNDVLKGNAKVCFSELYKIFGEKYKEYYMNQVNKIFA